jgi:hypothetical protein
MPHLSRTDFVLQTSKAHFEALPATDPNKALVGVFLTFLVCISFYSEMELKVLAMVRARMAVAGDPKLSNLIEASKRGILSRIKKVDLAECAGLFGSDVRAAFNASVTPQDATLYGNLITQRHAVAHSEDGQLVDWTVATLSLVDVENGLGAAERLIEAFEAAIQ